VRNVIEIDDLTKRYGQKLAVDGVSLSVGEGESFGYLGPNGAGKTTTIRCMLGLVRPQQGRIRILGHDVSTELEPVLAGVGHLPGEFGLWPQMTGRECLRYLAELHPRGPAGQRDLCERFELSNADLDRQVRVYSRGMKQKIGLIQAFQHEPPLVILDEPTEGLDPLMKERFVELLADHRSRGGTTFLSSHILSEVEQTTQRVAVLRAGRLVKVGPVENLTGDRVRHCTVWLKEPADPSALSVPGVSDVEAGSDGRTFRFDVHGDMGPLIQALARLPVEDFVAEPEHLSEAFFDVYEAESPA
jgi:beta-exotoxin I transport system ATP-binding protein